MEENFKNAYKEVDIILDNLQEEDYNKIPKDVIEAIRENKNDDYEFNLDFNKELKDNDLLPETRAILFNLFRDYLSTPNQKEKILKWQDAERKKEEQQKEENYKGDMFYKKEKTENIASKSEKDDSSISELEVNQNGLPALTTSEGIFTKIWNFIKGLFRK